MACKCDVGLGNTGLPNCEPIASVAKKLIVVPTYNDAGAKNGILLTDTLDQAYWDARVNDVDVSQRWFPLASMENITHERADSITEAAGSGRTAFIREGLKTFAGEMWKQSPAYLGKLKEARCTDISVFIVDNDGNIIGSCPDADGYIYPIQVDKESWDARTVESTDTTVQKVSLSFNWSDDEKDEDIRMVTADDYTGGVLTMKGLLDVYGVDGAASATTDTLTITLESIYGSKASLVKIKGQAIGNFTFLASGAGAITPSGLVETNGTYVFTFNDLDLIAAETVNVTLTTAGFDSTNLTSVDIVVAA